MSYANLLKIRDATYSVGFEFEVSSLKARIHENDFDQLYKGGLGFVMIKSKDGWEKEPIIKVAFDMGDLGRTVADFRVELISCPTLVSSNNRAGVIAIMEARNWFLQKVNSMRGDNKYDHFKFKPVEEEKFKIDVVVPKKRKLSSGFLRVENNKRVGDGQFSMHNTVGISEQKFYTVLGEIIDMVPTDRISLVTDYRLKISQDKDFHKANIGTPLHVFCMSDWGCSTIATNPAFAEVIQVIKTQMKKEDKNFTRERCVLWFALAARVISYRDYQPEVQFDRNGDLGFECNDGFDIYGTQQLKNRLGFLIKNHPLIGQEEFLTEKVVDNIKKSFKDNIIKPLYGDSEPDMKEVNEVIVKAKKDIKALKDEGLEKKQLEEAFEALNAELGNALGKQVGGSLLPMRRIYFIQDLFLDMVLNTETTFWNTTLDPEKHSLLKDKERSIFFEDRSTIDIVGYEDEKISFQISAEAGLMSFNIMESNEESPDIDSLKSVCDRMKRDLSKVERGLEKLSKLPPRAYQQKSRKNARASYKLYWT